jgi:uncharacterized protein (TIGR00299 family) protein
MIAYMDCYAGASGDMILGALLDAGLSLADLQSDLDKLNLPITVKTETVQKGAIRGTQAHVIAEDDAHSRTLTDITALIQAADLPDEIKSDALRIFQRLGEAEAHVHGVPVEMVHLHEVGGLDAIADIVGVVVGLHLMGVDRIVVSPLPMGSGSTDSMHGAIPLPAPAVASLVAGWPVRGVDVETELVTPTGAAVLTTLADAAGPMPAMTVVRVGYGTGRSALPFPNVLRVWLGEESKSDGRLNSGRVKVD